MDINPLTSSPAAAVVGFLLGIAIGAVIVGLQRRRARSRIAMRKKLMDQAYLKGRKRDALAHATEIRVLEQVLPWKEQGAADPNEVAP